jgi:hypothetical protein
MLGTPTPNFSDASSEFDGSTTTGHSNAKRKATRGYGSSCWVYAYTVAQGLVSVLKRCGDDLTRANIMKQVASIKDLSLPRPVRFNRRTLERRRG